MSWFAVGQIVSLVALAWLGHASFGMPVWQSAIAVAMSFLLALVACRVTGETDTTPVGAMGKVTQLAFGALSPGNVNVNLMSARKYHGRRGYFGGGPAHRLEERLSAWRKSPSAVSCPVRRHLCRRRRQRARVCSPGPRRAGRSARTSSRACRPDLGRCCRFAFAARQRDNADIGSDPRQLRSGNSTYLSIATADTRSHIGDLPHALTPTKGKVMSRMSSLGYSAAAALEEEVYAESESGEPELTISQMSRLNGVSLRTLRFYEDRGLIKPRREGNARFTGPLIRCAWR